MRQRAVLTVAFVLVAAVAFALGLLFASSRTTVGGSPSSASAWNAAGRPREPIIDLQLDGGVELLPDASLRLDPSARVPPDVHRN